MREEQQRKYYPRRKKSLLSAVLILALLATTLFGSRTAESVTAASGTVTMTLTDSGYSVTSETLGMTTAHTLWNLKTTEGTRTFCLTPGGSCCSGDTYSYTTYNAVTYENQALAKAMTYYGQNLTYSKLTHATIQAYIWACGKGVSKLNSVYEAGHSVDSSYTLAKAQSLITAIDETNPEGTIYYYTCTKCKNSKSLSKHQTLISWTSTTVTPSYSSCTVKKSGSDTKTVTVNLTKSDAQTGALIDTATFAVYADGELIKTVSTSGGKATVTYTRSYTTQEYSSTKNYVTNWDQLSVSQKTQLTKSGYYESKSAANAAALCEVEEKVAAALSALAQESHTWTIVETAAPSGHYMTEATSTKILTETASTTVLEANFINAAQTGTIVVNKINSLTQSASILGTEATAKGAEYTVYAAASILSGDGSVLYQKNDVVGTITIGDDWSGSLSGLPMGKYTVKETTAPTGMALDTNTYSLTLSADNTTATATVKVTSTDREYTAGFALTKTYGGSKKESGAVFEIINSRGSVVQTLTTNTRGYAETTEDLPYGTYTVHQVSGKDGYQLAADFTITVDEATDGTVISVELDNPEIPKDPYIEIIKVMVKEDADSDLYQRRMEEGAEFVLTDADGNVVDTLVTDSAGYAKSVDLSPGTYTVTQTGGADSYTLTDPFTVEIVQGESNPVHSYTLVDYYEGVKIRLYKTMTGDGETNPESYAQFVVYDLAKTQGIDTDISTTEKREAFLAALEEADAVLGSMTTDEDGFAVLLLDASAVSEAGFGLLQVSGAYGYALAELADSASAAECTVDGQFTVYTYRLEDVFDDYGTIAVRKEQSVSAEETIAEAGATFTLTNLETGEVVDTLVTDSQGYASSVELPYGVYLLHQVEGSAGYALAEDQVIRLTEENYHSEYSCALVDRENPVTVTLRKSDARDGSHMLSEAVYQICDEEGQVVAVLLTDEAGEATCQLPYGTYTLTEIQAPAGYALDTTAETFVLSAETTTLVEDTLTYTLEKSDEELFGHLVLNKTGQVLVSYEEDHFVYEEQPLAGAEYALYAAEDIVSADGETVYYLAGECVSTAVTDENGQIVFSRRDEDDQETTDLYLGAYYVVETVAPEGFVLDTEKHYVTLSAETPENAIESATPVPDVEEGTGSVKNILAITARVVDAEVALGAEITGDMLVVTAVWDDGSTQVLEAGEYVLDQERAPTTQGRFLLTITLNAEAYPDEEVASTRVEMTAVENDPDTSRLEIGSSFCEDLPDSATAVVFCRETAPEGVSLTDVSAAGDGSIVAWLQDGVYYVSPQNDKTVIVFSADSREMFYGKTALRAIDFGEGVIDTSQVAYLTLMFYNCSGLTELDLSAFDTGNVTNMYGMFSYCSSLTSLELGSPDTANVTNMSRLFQACSSLTSLDLSSWDTSAVKNMSYMFQRCTGLTELNLDHLDTSSVTDMSYMFSYCYMLQSEMTLRGTRCTSYDNMFQGACTGSNACFTLHYTEEAKSLAQEMVETRTTSLCKVYLGSVQAVKVETEEISSVYAASITQTAVQVLSAYTQTAVQVLSAVGSAAGDGEQSAEATENGIQVELNLTDEAQTINPRIRKVNEEGEVLSGAIFQICALVDILNAQGQIVVPAGTVIRTVETDEYGYADFGDTFPTTLYAGGSGDLYEITEVSAPDGYVLSQESLRLDGVADSEEAITTVELTRINEASPVVLIRKIWDDGNDADGLRPDSLSVTVWLEGEAVGTYTLSADNDWCILTDLPVQSKGKALDYTFTEEELAEYYGEITYENGVARLTNTHLTDTVRLTVTKVWEDASNEDEIRPEQVEVALYANGVYQETVTLCAENGWMATLDGLDRYTEAGVEIEYVFQ